MISDPIIEKFIRKLYEAKSQKQSAISSMNFENMFQVGRMQGTIFGLDESLKILNEVLAESEESDDNS